MWDKQDFMEYFLVFITFNLNTNLAIPLHKKNQDPTLLIGNHI